MGFLAWIAQTGLGVLVRGLLDSVLAWLQQRRAEQAQRDHGATQQKAAHQATTIAAQQRDDEASARPRDDATNSERIGNGTI